MFCFRYKDDAYDRLWTPRQFENFTILNTSLSIDQTSSNSLQPPLIVMRTANAPRRAIQYINMLLEPKDPKGKFYIYMHFAEIQDLEDDEIREFNITYNGGQNWYSYFRPRKLKIITIYNPRAVSSPDGNFNFSFVMTGNSTLPPLINSFEVYKVLDLLQLETDQDEGNLSMFLKFF